MMSKIETKHGEVMVECGKELGWKVLEIQPLDGMFGRYNDFRSLVTMTNGTQTVSFLTDVFNGKFDYEMDWVNARDRRGNPRVYQDPRYLRKYQPPVSAVVHATYLKLQEQGVIK